MDMAMGEVKEQGPVGAGGKKPVAFIASGVCTWSWTWMVGLAAHGGTIVTIF
jgi:hypothetical protein